MEVVSLACMKNFKCISRIIPTYTVKIPEIGTAKIIAIKVKVSHSLVAVGAVGVGGPLYLRLSL